MEDIKKNGVKLFHYLEQLALLNSHVRKNIKALSADEEVFDIEDEEFLPKLDQVYIKRARNQEEGLDVDVFLSIKRYEIEDSPMIPEDLAIWIDTETKSFIKPTPKEYVVIKENFKDSPERIKAFERLLDSGEKSDVLREWVGKDFEGKYEEILEKFKEVRFEDFPEKVTLYKSWITHEWEPWANRNKKFYQVNKAYDKLYALRGFLQTELDSFDLMWSHDILTWTKEGDEICHPTFFTPVKIEFSPDENKISIVKDEEQETFFDVSFVREALDDSNANLIDIDNLSESIANEINNNNFDVWNAELVHRYLNSLTRYISAGGKSLYNDKNIKEVINSEPVSINKHYVFLLKKSGKSWADYSKKIREDIQEKEILTPFLEDLICSESVKKLRIDTEQNGFDILDDTLQEELEYTFKSRELFFPTAYNDEQKKIAYQLDSNYGALVQGPPGTGKTHTIANLIARFLAQGKTVLVTSQTSQALSVLKEKIPSELRSMVVSQIETNAKRNDLQSSVTAINSALTEDDRYTEKRKVQIEKDLGNVRVELSVNEKELERKSLLDSVESIEIGSDLYNPISGAKYLSKFQEEHDFLIKDDIPFDEEISITQEDLNAYIDGLESIKKDLWNLSSSSDFPALENLPSIELLERFFYLRNELCESEAHLSSFYIPNPVELGELSVLNEYFVKYEEYETRSNHFRNYAKDRGIIQEEKFQDLVSRYSHDYLQSVLTALVELHKTLTSFDTEWERSIFASIASEVNKDRWMSILGRIGELLSQYNSSYNHLLGKQVTVGGDYNLDIQQSIDVSTQILERSKSGGKVKKGVSLLFDSDAKKVMQSIRVDDHEISSTEDITLVVHFFIQQRIEKELTTLWNQGFNNIPNAKSIPNHFDFLEYQNDVKSIYRIVNLDENHEPLKDAINGMGIFDTFNPSSIQSVKDAMEICENFISLYQKQEYHQLIESIANQFEIENAHDSVLLLQSAIKNKDILSVNQLTDSLHYLYERQLLAKECQSLELQVYSEKMKELDEDQNKHSTVLEIFSALKVCDLAKINRIYESLPELTFQQNNSKKLKAIEGVVSQYLSKTVIEVKRKIENGEEVDFDLKSNIKFSRINNWLNTLHQGESISEISRQISILRKKEQECILQLASNSAWMHLKKRVTKEQKEALGSFALSMKKRGMGTGKYAGKHLNDAKKALKIGKGAVPVWIMPIDMIHRLFPEPTAEMFDVVIFDEASQVDARGLNIAYIGKKLLVVGDDEQVSPTSFVDQSKVTDLIARHISDIPNGHHFSSTSSLFDIAKIKMTDVITLTEHFRSIEEIIGFSNRLCYDGKLKVLRDQLPVDRLDPVLEPIFVEGGYEETNQKVNRIEAEAIVQKLKEMLNDEKYREMRDGQEVRPTTFGIISLLGKDQSKYISKLISEYITPKEIEKRRIICGDPYVFQGDERDVILLSMVKSIDIDNPDKSIYPLTESKKENKQRMNVAMSRAKNKMILFHSIPKDKLTNPNDLRKKIIDWFYTGNHEQKEFGLDKVRQEVENGKASEFEFEVAKLIINRGFKVIPQYEVAGYRIDLVIQGENAKLAIECDGDKYHNRIEKWEEDNERQQILERSGWKFWRVSGSSFYRHQEKALESLWEKLDEMGIEPKIDGCL